MNKKISFEDIVKRFKNKFPNSELWDRNKLKSLGIL